FPPPAGDPPPAGKPSRPLGPPGHSRKFLRLAQPKLLNGNDMSRFPSLIRFRCAVGGWFGAIVLVTLVVQLVCARTPAIPNGSNNRCRNPDPLNGGAQL